MNAPGRLKIGFIGAGKVGVVFAAALRAAEHDIVGVSASSEQSIERAHVMIPGVPIMGIEEVVAASDLVFLTIPDDVLPSMIEGLAKLQVFKAGQLVAHTSGRYGTEIFAPATACGALALAIHPAMTFTGTSLDIGRMVDCGFAVTATNTLLPIAQALVIEMGGIPQIVASEDRALYHAALAHASNHTATIMTQASEILSNIGISKTAEYLKPLVDASVDNALQMGPSALTGPIVRGDVETVAAHLEALEGTTLASYKALGRATLAQVTSNHFHRLTPLTVQRLEELLA